MRTPAAAAAVEAVRRPVGYTPRRGGGLTSYERVLVRAGFGPVVGMDEAGRGACAGPLVVAAVSLDRWGGDRRIELADSKALTARAREAAYRQITKSARAWSVIVIEPGEIDMLGLHVCNVAGMRRALASLPIRPGYVLTDGFEVPGLAVPALAMWKGDQVAACVAAASIVAKVTRDKIMRTLHVAYPEYGFARHKGYSTPSHMAALDSRGPCPVHRRSFVNVLSRLREQQVPISEYPTDDEHLDGLLSAPCAEDDDGTVAPVDEWRDGPIVEMIAGSLTTGLAGVAGLADRPPASSEGRT